MGYSIIYVNDSMLNYRLFLVLTLLTTGIIGYATFATARLLRDWKPDRNLLLMPAENALRLFLVTGLILLGVLSGLPASTLGWTWTNLWHEMLIGIAWGVGIALFFFATTYWLYQQQVAQRIYSTALIEAILPRSFEEATLVFLAMIPAVVVEELLFRSLLLGGFRLLISPMVLLLLTSVLFGVLHSSQGVWGMAGAAVGGFAFGILFVWRETLVTPIVAHYVANTLQIGIAMRWFRP